MIKLNKGIGAGGKNTNVYGKNFESITDNLNNLYSKGFKKYKINSSKNGFYLQKNFEEKKIVYVTQTGLNYYINKFFNIKLFRNPDEAYIIIFKNKEFKPIIKILEKKNQNVEGSVETKLWACSSLRREYELILGKNFKVVYGLSVNTFLQNKFENKDNIKYKTLKQILRENEIDILYGENKNYFDSLDKWINK